MVDLEKEQNLFKETMLNKHYEYENEKEFEKDKHGDFSWIGTDSDFAIWQMCAEQKQQEINRLQEKLNQANKESFKKGLKDLVSDALTGNKVKNCKLELKNGSVIHFDLTVHVKEMIV